MQKNMVLCALASFVLGGALMWGYNTFQQRTDSAFDRAVFEEHEAAWPDSAFDELDRFNRNMDNIFDDPFASFGRSFGRSFDGPFESRFGSIFKRDFTMAPLADIETREDSEHFTYVLDVDGKDVANIDVVTENGYVSISAEVKERTANSTSSMSISQRMPLPFGVDPNSTRVLHEDGEVLVRFQKVS